MRTALENDWDRRVAELRRDLFPDLATRSRRPLPTTADYGDHLLLLQRLTRDAARQFRADRRIQEACGPDEATIRRAIHVLTVQLLAYLELAV